MRMKASTSSELNESLPLVAREVLRVFEDELSGVRFGEIDAGRLAEVAARVITIEGEVETARERLDAAKRVHEHELGELTALANKALAYARIHAEGDAALSERLAKLAAPEAPPRKRRRRKKAAESATELKELPFEGQPLAPAASA